MVVLADVGLAIVPPSDVHKKLVGLSVDVLVRVMGDPTQPRFVEVVNAAMGTGGPSLST